MTAKSTYYEIGTNSKEKLKNDTMHTYYYEYYVTSFIPVKNDAHKYNINIISRRKYNCPITYLI